MKTTSILLMTTRIIGSILLIMGLLIWTGNVYSLVLIHIVFGSILTLALFVLTYQAYRAGVSRPLVLLAAVWGLALPIGGLAQGRILPDSLFVFSQVLHLICGVGAVGLAEILAARTRKKGA